MAWHWRYENSDGTPVEPAAAPEAPRGEAFPTQSDAENWIGETWRELLHAGVAQVSLLEDDRVVYGPMGLDAPQ